MKNIEEIKSKMRNSKIAYYTAPDGSVYAHGEGCDIKKIDAIEYVCFLSSVPVTPATIEKWLIYSKTQREDIRGNEFVIALIEKGDDKSDVRKTKPLDDEIAAIIAQRIEKTKSILTEKAKQYARKGRLGNFKDIAALLEIDEKLVCMVLMAKHIIALKDYIKSPADSVPMEQYDEKIGDIICYMHLLEAMVKVK